MAPEINLFSVHPDDRQIIDNLSAGAVVRRKTEGELFAKYAYFIQEGIKKYSLREEEAFDAYSDTLLAAIASITNGTFESRSSIKTYIYRVFNNKCVDIIRKKTTNKSSVNRTMEITGSLAHLSDTAKSIVQQLVEKSDLEDMKKRLATIGESCRSLLTMFAEGYSDREIADEMNYKTPEVVKTSRLRCLQKLRQSYMMKEQ
jgi:RNA polymerase sigma-70 factor (ECF subfamily)